MQCKHPDAEQLAERIKVSVDHEAAPSDLDQALARFLLILVRRPPAATGTAAAVNLTTPEAAEQRH